MASPNPLLLLVLYRIYRNNFINNPKNAGKKPQGCFVWSFLFILKFAAVICAIMMIFYLIIWLNEMF